uniref:Glutathione S-transferase epsilon 4 n=1 Tax=Cnaphalocrocis medinalis TaxID=437488 RepID=A0A077D6F2_CNAME|nr:glutathione S-transferase epsilon 4 [Cnaphalocrocis medinalis]
MPAKLYKMDLSPPARAAMLACEIFNVPVELVDTNLMAGEHLKPEFLKMNPCHTIPVLVDGDITLHDSHAIIMYLADTYGNNSALYPKDVKQRALVNQKLFFNSSVLFTRLRNVTIPAFKEGVKGLDDKKRTDIEEAYKYLEAFLSGTKYLAGNTITIADIAALTTIGGLSYIVPLDGDKYPKLKAWFEELENKPYSQKVNAGGAKALGEFIKSCIQG